MPKHQALIKINRCYNKDNNNIKDSKCAKYYYPNLGDISESLNADTILYQNKFFYVLKLKLNSAFAFKNYCFDYIVINREEAYANSNLSKPPLLIEYSEEKELISNCNFYPIEYCDIPDKSVILDIELDEGVKLIDL